MAFEPDVQIQVLAAKENQLLYGCDLVASAFSIGWLPRGEYRLQCHMHDLQLPSGNFLVRMTCFATMAGERTVMDECTVPFVNPAAVSSTGLARPAWSNSGAESHDSSKVAGISMSAPDVAGRSRRRVCKPISKESTP